jgi:hypothetical protein
MKVILTLPYTGDVSVNRYARHTPKGGVYIMESAKLWGLFVRSGLNSVLPTDFDGKWLDESHPFDLDVFVAFPRQFSKRSGDASNFDKWPRDVVAGVLGVDDAGTEGKQTSSYGNKEAASIELTIDLHLKPEMSGHLTTEILQWKWSNK